MSNVSVVPSKASPGAGLNIYVKFWGPGSRSRQDGIPATKHRRVTRTENFHGTPDDDVSLFWRSRTTIFENQSGDI